MVVEAVKPYTAEQRAIYERYLIRETAYQSLSGRVATEGMNVGYPNPWISIVSDRRPPTHHNLTTNSWGRLRELDGE